MPALLPQSARGMYDPKHGRWLQRDPAGYVDGMNLYEYVNSMVTVLIDPEGLLANTCLFCAPRWERAPGQDPAGWKRFELIQPAAPWTIGTAVGIGRCINGQTAVRINGTQFYLTGTPKTGMHIPKTGSTSYFFIYKATDPNKLYRSDYDLLKVGPNAGQQGWEDNQKGVAKILNLKVCNHQPAGRGARIAGGTLKILRYAGKPLLVIGVAQSAAEIGVAAYRGEDVKRTIVQEAGTWAGAIGGACGGAKLCGWAGAYAGPWGAGVGVVVGGIGGGIGGAILGRTVSVVVYDFVVEQLQEEEWVLSCCNEEEQPYTE
jgi:uncharacterized protein RhaS with RHS repeats